MKYNEIIIKTDTGEYSIANARMVETESEIEIISDDGTVAFDKGKVYFIDCIGQQKE